ncbi:hypothetical protein [Anaerobiospirillum thomasii]|uniref:hypothetical protein n=1 Tax=Anaerobiospirillum thomasii TaxID=179995 RepID=UPI000DE591ED|nr:hypothetical protein [Anaerobiospirillum thomasii]
MLFVKAVWLLSAAAVLSTDSCLFINNLSLQDFTQVARNTSNDNARIKLTSDGVKSTSLHTFNTTSQKAMGAFLNTLKRRLAMPLPICPQLICTVNLVQIPH